MRRKMLPTVHKCGCRECQTEPNYVRAEAHIAINRVMAIADERQRRLIAGLIARLMDKWFFPRNITNSYSKGVAPVAVITGISPDTIRRGWKELKKRNFSLADRTRRPGAGRKRADRCKDGG
jgi:hypothetical protein